MWSHLEREIIFIPPMNTFIHTQNTLHMYCTTQILYVSTTLQRTDTHPQWRSWSQPGCGYKANQHTHFFFLTRYHFACAEHVSQFDKGCLCNCRRVGEEWNGNPPAHWCTLWCSMLALCFCPACDWLNLSKRVLWGFNSGTLGASNINLSNNLLRRTCLKVGKTFPVAYL